MLDEFPLIDDFFKQKKFSDAELQNLIAKLEEKHNSHKTLEKARSIIDLQLLKFKLKKVEPKRSVPKVNSSKAKNAKQSYHIDKIDLFLKHTLGKPLIKVCYYLSIDELTLINHLELDSVKDLRIIRFENSHYQNIKDLVKSYLKIQESELKDGLRKVPVRSKNFKKPSKDKSGVFSKIKAQGGVGKIIYIRS